MGQAGAQGPLWGLIVASAWVRAGGQTAVHVRKSWTGSLAPSWVLSRDGSISTGASVWQAGTSQHKEHQPSSCFSRPSAVCDGHPLLAFLSAWCLALPAWSFPGTVPSYHQGRSQQPGPRVRPARSWLSSLCPPGWAAVSEKHFTRLLRSSDIKNQLVPSGGRWLTSPHTGSPTFLPGITSQGHSDL